MTDTRVVHVRSDAAGMGGLLWFMGWLFTLGFLHLHLVKGIYALLLWPYFLGAHFAK